ncbi:MAG: MFS transporter [Planctomycetes bacterium]|nr:MFS transporter [Planctomycetota bacterium]
MNDSQTSHAALAAFAPPPLSATARMVVLVAAFLGWFFAGFQMSITSLAMREAAIDLLDRTGRLDREQFNELNRLQQAQKKERTAAPALSPGEQRQLAAWRAQAARWFAWYQCAFLFGAATGGLALGRLGDRIGRAKAMAASILCYSAFSGAAYFAQNPFELLLLRFMANLGVGGMWPNGVALVSESWSNLSRPMAAGLIGTSANVGIFLMATVATNVKITSDDWRWVMLVGAGPLVLGLISLVVVPESPRWLAARDAARRAETVGTPAAGVFHPPLLWVTLVGIALATIPLVGGWGSANWMVPWAGEAGETASPPNPYLKAQVQQARSMTGVVGSFLGGWFGSIVGRRRAYFIASLGALACAQYAFWFILPTDDSFLWWVGALGLFSGLYFGWLPLFLPELFPTRVRSTGAGVSFNFGRILTAVTIFATGALMEVFAGDYARIGRITSLVFALGLVIVWFTPDTSRTQLQD